MVANPTEHDEAADDLPTVVRQKQPSNPSLQLPRQSLVITNGVRRSRGTKNRNISVILALMTLVCFWVVCFVLLLARSGTGSVYIGGTVNSAIVSVHDVMGSYRSGLRNRRQTQNERENQAIEEQKQQQQKETQKHQYQQNHVTQQEVVEASHHHHRSSHKIVTEPHLVSRMPNKVVATA